MKFSAALLFAAPFLSRVLADDDGDDAPVAIGTYKNCPLYGDDYEPEIDMSSWTLSASGCATAASVVDNVVTYTSMVRRKVKNTSTGEHTYAYIAVDEYVEEMLENKKELLESTCEYCEDENFIAACVNAGHDMGQEEEEEEEEEQADEADEAEEDAQEDEAQENNGDGRRLLRKRELTTNEGIYTSFSSMCTNCQSLCGEEGEDANDGSVNEHELMEAKLELIKELSGCQRIEQEDDENDENDNNGDDEEEEVEYYSDILCTDSGFVIQVFEDEDCTTPSSDKTISDFTFVLENECAQAEDDAEDGDADAEEQEEGACNVALTPDLSILVDNTGLYCSESKQFEATFGFLDGIVNVEEEDENGDNGDGDEEEEEEISRSCDELGKDSMFCPVSINGCVGISSDEYDTCLHMETIGTSKSTIQIIGSGYLVNSEGQLVSKWGVSDGAVASGFTKLLLSVAVAATAAFAVMSCFYHGKLSSGNKTNVALSGQGGHGV